MPRESNPSSEAYSMLLKDRIAQIVPTLTPAQMQFALRLASGPAQHFAPEEKLLDVGDRNTAVWLVVAGSIIASRRDGLGGGANFCHRRAWPVQRRSERSCRACFVGRGLRRTG